MRWKGAPMRYPAMTALGRLRQVGELVVSNHSGHSAFPEADVRYSVSDMPRGVYCSCSRFMRNACSSRQLFRLDSVWIPQVQVKVPVRPHAHLITHQLSDDVGRCDTTHKRRTDSPLVAAQPFVGVKLSGTGIPAGGII